MTCINLTARTGQQFSISHGDYEAVITELGATMRKLTYKGEDLTVALGPDDLVTWLPRPDPHSVPESHRGWRVHVRRQDLFAADR